MKTFVSFSAKKIGIKGVASVLLLSSFIFISESFFVEPRKHEQISNSSCDSVPVLNKRVIEFVDSKMNTKVGMGECWDLAAEALNHIGAKWVNEYKFGREVKQGKECIYPGDIIQFDKIKIEYREKNMVYSENLSHHTAIVHEVITQEHLIMAEQNTGKLGHKVGLSPLEFKNIKSGKYKIYRPVPIK